LTRLGANAKRLDVIVEGGLSMLPELWCWWVANREHVVPLVTLIAGPIGLWLLFIRTRAADRTAEAAATQAKTAADRHEAQTDADRERRITESFAKAVEQLGSDKRETRLGAIYTLERISQERESEREYGAVGEVVGIGGWRNLRLVQTASTGVGAPGEITP
jgi:hypothetical protein